MITVKREFAKHLAEKLIIIGAQCMRRATGPFPQ
jgi:hypothetical protein